MNSDGVASRIGRVRTRYYPYLDELLAVFARVGSRNTRLRHKNPISRHR